jgi:hypothetical protein
MKSVQIGTPSITKNRDLVISILLDSVGYFSYAIPFVGEFTDVIWAPIAAFLMTRIYKGRTGRTAGVLEFIEEVIPFTDFIPTFTLTWIYTYIIKKGT